MLAALAHAGMAWAQGTPGTMSDALWVDQFGSEDHDWAGAVAVHGSDVYVTWHGYNPAGLRKYDAEGNLAWESDLTARTSLPVAVWADGDRVCVGGAARQPLAGDTEVIEGTAGYVRCFGRDGDVLWTRYVQASTNRAWSGTRVYALAGDRNEILVIGSTSNTPVECTRKGCTGGRGSSAFFQKYHARDGSLLASGPLRSTGYEIPAGVAMDSSGEADVWGTEYETSQLASRVDVHIRVRHLDGNGVVNKTADTPWGSTLPAALTLAGSAFYVAGPSGPSGSGAKVLRYDWDPQRGVLEPTGWSADLPGAEVLAMHARPSSLLVVGRILVPAPGQPGVRESDAFIREYDLGSGSEVGTIPFGTAGMDDQASAVGADASRVFVAGYTNGSMTPGGSLGESDAFVARFAGPFDADAGGPYSADEGSVVTLSASTTGVDFGQTLTYKWDLDGDGVFEEPGKTVAYAARDDTAEPVTVRVQVTDEYSLGTAEATATVAVANVAPIVDAGPDVYLAAGQGLSRWVVFTDPGTDTWSASVDWGDGSVGTRSGLSATTFTLDHVYASPGTYAVTVTVADEDGGVGTDVFRVTVWGSVVTIPEVIAAVQLLVDQGVLNAGQGNSLITKLLDAQAALDAGDTQTAVEDLNAFVHEVEALENARILDASQAGNLIAMAQAVIASISG